MELPASKHVLWPKHERDFAQVGGLESKSCRRMTASKASLSISSEINPQGEKTEPRRDRKYGGEEGMSTALRQPLGDLAGL